MASKQMEDAVAAFLAIVNRSQTRELCEWNAESLRRALRWAAIVEAAAIEQQQQESGAEELLRERFPVATLPTLAPGAPLRLSDLRRATQHLLGAVLQSPFLPSHPVRSELAGLVLAKARAQRQSDPESPVVSSRAIARFLAKTAAEAQRSRHSETIALAVSKAFKPMNVSVLSSMVPIPPIESYLLHPRTVKLSQIASTLQLNAVNARAAADRIQYDSLLDSVRRQLARDTSNDISEMLGLLVTHSKGPPLMPNVPLRVEEVVADFVQILVDWARNKVSRCMVLPPWLAAMVTSKHDSFAVIYVTYLLQSGFLEPDHAFAHRVAALVTQSERLSMAVSNRLAQMDPLVLSKLLP